MNLGVRNKLAENCCGQGEKQNSDEIWSTQ